MTKPVILTGLRANNDLHIGNYLGALLPMVDMAKKHAGEYQINLFVPDLHSFTTPIDHSQLQNGIMQNLRMFIAADLPLDNPDVYIYRQSYVPAHSELTWILDCFTGMGEMSRMTQFKDKSRQQAKVDVLKKGVAGKVPPGMTPSEAAEHDAQVIAGRKTFTEQQQNVSVGLFNYPVLMAADILLYGATYVPVGDDQTQHLEFTRDIGERMNKRFGELFTIPKPVAEQHQFFGKDQGLRIKDLADPTKKMSKSDASGKGVIFMTDTPEAARGKVMSATTDSLGDIAYDAAKQPGITNLIDILALLSNREPAEVQRQYEGQSQYGPFKTAVCEAVVTFLKDFQARLASVDDKVILAKLEASERQMNEQANATLLKVQKAVGLRA